MDAISEGLYKKNGILEILSPIDTDGTTCSISTGGIEEEKARFDFGEDDANQEGTFRAIMKSKFKDSSSAAELLFTVSVGDFFVTLSEGRSDRAERAEIAFFGEVSPPCAADTS